MIGLGILILLGLYIGLFVLVWKKVETLPARIAVSAVLLSPVIWKIADSSVGYYKYKQACAAEAGVNIYEKDLPPAKRLRLEGTGFGAISAEHVLKNYPSLLQVEAAASNVHVLPPAYAVYERGSDGKVVSSLMDKVGRRGGHGETQVFETAPSQAQYTMSRSSEYLPYRLIKEQHVLRNRAGHLVATVTAFGYTDTDPNHSLLRMPWGRAEGCGPGEREKDILLNLIATQKQSNGRS